MSLAVKRNLERRWHEARQIAGAFFDRDRPILAQIIPTRRCNLSCTYCNEYDKVSEPVPTAAMLRRLDRLAELGTCIVTFSGGEPMMHPDLDALIARVRERGIIAGLITNGFYLGAERIKRLNQAGLEHLQVSIDNVEPDEISRKSLKTLDKKLVHLAEHAEFEVNINTVVGGGMKNPDDAVQIAQRAAELGFSTSVGIVHDEHGQLKPLTPRESAIYDECVRLGKGLYTRINDFQKNLIDGRPNVWQCRAGARYLYVCEDGLVHYCSQQRGAPAIPLEQYGVEDIRAAFDAPKSCAPYCTIGCVHRASALDNTLGPLISAATLPRRLSTVLS
jgi:MoaA/NifB/PqqE/SkfB family radical SAM enzyme